MQSRDPFSGDCDVHCDFDLHRDIPPQLAEPRPVLRGLRRFHPPRPPGTGARSLAEPRPVLRGLRQVLPAQEANCLCHPPCRAETRSQGIATGALNSNTDLLAPNRLAEPRPVLRGLRLAACYPDASPRNRESCRAETRSQGIATARGSKETISERDTCLQSRDPFSGDCDVMANLLTRDSRIFGLQSRDPFSGDCDMISRDGRFGGKNLVDLQSRDPFSGDCDTLPPRAPTSTIPLRLAEPRPVLRGLRQ